MPSYRKIVMAAVGIFLAVLLMASQFGGNASEITIDPSSTYQTITGWEAMAYAADWPGHSEAYPKYMDELLDRAVDELGITRLRLELHAGAENQVDYGAQFLNGQLTEREYVHDPGYIYQVLNDNEDPNEINPQGFNYTWLDHFVTDMVIPMKARVDEAGLPFFLTLTVVDFGDQELFSANPEEFAEFVLAAFLHLDEEFGIVPDGVEVLEPNQGTWNPNELARGFVAAGNRLAESGYQPGFIGPSHPSMRVSLEWFDEMVEYPEILNYLTELSYHRYAGIEEEHLRTIGSRAVEYVINTSMLEHMGSPYQNLHADLEIGRVSAWSGGYSLAGKYPDFDLYRIDDTNPDEPRVLMNEMTKFYRQYTYFVHPGAVRIGAESDDPSMKPLAFLQPDGSFVVVVLSESGGEFSLANLPDGRYGMVYTTRGEAAVPLPDQRIEDGNALQGSIPAKGVITIFRDEGDPTSPVAGESGFATQSSGSMITASPNGTGTPTPTPDLVPGAAPEFDRADYNGLPLSEALKNTEFLKEALKWVRRLQPNQAGVILIGLLLTVIVAWNTKRVRSGHNLDLLLLLLPSIFLFDLITLGDRPSSLRDPARATLFGLLFLGLFASSILLFIRAILRGVKPSKSLWSPNVSESVLLVLLVLFTISNIALTLMRPPDDAGNYTNLGAYAFTQTGHLPYGNPDLKGGAAATYGPILYLAHIPFQFLIDSGMFLLGLHDQPLVRRILIGPTDPNYMGPPVMATKFAVIAFQLIAIAGLVYVGRRLIDRKVGLSLGLLYAGSPYVMGIGGEELYITGLTFISHIAPAAITILAFAVLDRPRLAGGLLAIAAGALFYPVFFLPLWIGYLYWRKGNWVQFLLGFLIVAALLFAGVYFLTQHDPGESPMSVIYQSTVGHQEGKDAYGSSTFSFWGTHPGLANFWQEPLIEGWSLLKPTFLLFLGFLAASFFLSRDRSLPQLALLTAAVAISIQLWKSHAGGTYVEWYYPFFLIGLLTRGSKFVLDNRPTEISHEDQPSDPDREIPV